MQPEPLLLVGAGGLAREVADTVDAVNAGEPTWRIIGCLDDDASLVGTSVHGHEVLGPLAAADEIDPSARLALCVASPSRPFVRKHVARALDPAGDRLITLVHPAAWLSPSTRVGAGAIVLAGSVATADVAIGAGCLLMPHVTLTHDDVLDDFVVCASAATLGGGVHVGEGAYLGAGCRIREQRDVGAWSLVGMGAVVVEDVPVGQVWTGCPARYLRSIDLDGGASG